MYESKQDCDAVLTGHSIQVTAHEKLPDEEKTETFTLVFPSNCKLTDRHFVPSGESVDEQEIESFLIMGKVDTDIKRMDKTTKKEVAVKSLAFTIAWRLSDMNTEAVVKGEAKKKAKAAQQMDDYFDGTP